MRAFLLVCVANIACASVPSRPTVDICAGALTCEVAASRVLVGDACTASLIDIIDGPDQGHGPSTSSLSVVDGENCPCRSANLISWQPESWRVSRKVAVKLSAWELERIQSDLVEVKRADASAGELEQRISFVGLLSRARGGLSDDLVCSIAALDLPVRAFSAHWPQQGTDS